MASEAVWITIIMIVKLKGNYLRAFIGKLTTEEAEKQGGKIVLQEQLNGLSPELPEAVIIRFADLIEVPPDSVGVSIEFIANFMDGYKQKIKEYLKNEQIEGLENRIIRFLGITILYRIFGFYLVVNVKQNEEFWKLAAHKMLTDKKSDSLVDVLHKLNLVELT